MFFKHLALCNTVLCEFLGSKKDILYKASSPDELALVNGAKSVGILLMQREHNKV